METEARLIDRKKKLYIQKGGGVEGTNCKYCWEKNEIKDEIDKHKKQKWTCYTKDLFWRANTLTDILIWRTLDLTDPYFNGHTLYLMNKLVIIVFFQLRCFINNLFLVYPTQALIRTHIQNIQNYFYMVCIFVTLMYGYNVKGFQWKQVTILRKKGNRAMEK